MANVSGVHPVLNFFSECNTSLENVNIDKVIQNMALPIIGAIGSMSIYAFQTGAAITFPQVALLGAATGLGIYVLQSLAVHMFSKPEKEERVFQLEQKPVEEEVEEQILDSTPVESRKDFWVEGDYASLQDLSLAYQEAKQWFLRNFPDRKSLETYRNEAAATIKAELEKMPSKEVVFTGVQVAYAKAVEATKFASEEISKRLPTDEQIESTKKEIHQKFSAFFVKKEVPKE